MDSDDLAEWNEQPHVSGWHLDLEDLTVGNAAPNSVHRPRKRTREFVPTTALEKDFVRGVGTTGVSLLERLRASVDPSVADMAEDLLKYGDALKRVVVKVKDMTPASHAAWLPDGRIQINLNKDHIYSSSSSQERVLMHELLHGLSQHELQNPLNAKHVTAFDGLRNRMINLLPKDLRNAYNEITKVGADGSSWYSRYAKGHAEWKELEGAVGGDNSKANLLYGLLNNEQF